MEGSAYHQNQNQPQSEGGGWHRLFGLDARCTCGDVMDQATVHKSRIWGDPGRPVRDRGPFRGRHVGFANGSASLKRKFHDTDLSGRLVYLLISVHTQLRYMNSALLMRTLDHHGADSGSMTVGPMHESERNAFSSQQPPVRSPFGDSTCLPRNLIFRERKSHFHPAAPIADWLPAKDRIYLRSEFSVVKPGNESP